MTGGAKVKPCKKVHSFKNLNRTLTMPEAYLRPARDTPSFSSAINNLKEAEWGGQMTGTEDKPNILKRHTQKSTVRVRRGASIPGVSHFCKNGSCHPSLQTQLNYQPPLGQASRAFSTACIMEVLLATVPTWVSRELRVFRLPKFQLRKSQGFLEAELSTPFR